MREGKGAVGFCPSFEERNIMKNSWGYQKALKRIHTAKEENAIDLNLKDLGLTELPEEIGELTQLEILLLNNHEYSSTPNQLTHFPEALFHLKNLKELRLSSNLFQEIPASIEQLCNLKHLYMYGNPFQDLSETLSHVKNIALVEFSVSTEELLNHYHELKMLNGLGLVLEGVESEEIPEILFELENIVNLWLRRNKLKQLPPAVGKLTRLKMLIVRNNKLSELPETLAQLTELEVLDFSENQFKEIPPFVFQLTSLKELWVNSNQMERIQDEIGGLVQLRKLYVRNNKLSELPETFVQLTELEVLDFGENQFKEIPPFVFQLTSLKELWVYSNQMERIQEEIGGLVLLCKLSVRNNKLSELPETLVQMTELEVLDFGENQFKEIPHVVLQLTSLRELWVHSNQMERIPEEIGGLVQLRKLYVRNNKLSKLPETLAQMTKLEVLDFGENQFEAFPHVVLQLASLKELRIYGNQIKYIPEDIITLSHLRKINLRGNLIQNIPKEIASSNDVDEIFNYLRSLEEAEDVEYLYEAKLALVGRGFVGKTSLCRKLAIPDYVLEKKIPSTENIDILSWDLPIKLKHSDRFRLNLWDFAGQEKYDATHQYFLTERTLYLFVTEARQESNYLDFCYWLNVVTLLSNHSPVIVVQNKIDERHKQLPTKEYQERFPNILAFVNVSCTTGMEHTIKTLVGHIQDGIRKLPQVGDILPKPWVDIRIELKTLSQQKDTMSYEEYVALCEKHGLSSGQAELLSRYYHDLGIIVYYKDDILLKDLVIIKPDWAVDGAYAVLNSRKVQENKGSFTDADLAEIWDEPRYRKKQAELLSLMKNYELCFELGQSKNYIIPNLLPANPVSYEALNGEKSLKFVCQYPFMPAGILMRLIVRLHPYIENQAYWQQGVVLKHDNTRAEALEKRMEKKVSIQIEGSNCKGLLAIIRKELDEIHRDFHKLEFYEMIPCNCVECMKSESPHFYKYKTLRRFEEKGRETVPCEVSNEDVLIQKLISDVFATSLSDDYDKTIPKPSNESSRECSSYSTSPPVVQSGPKVFISYSSQDVDLQRKLNTALSTLKRKWRLDCWTDQEILPGNEWDSEIMENLKEADIVLLLISSDFIGSDYCYIKEMEVALQRHKDGVAKVIPVILRPCQWKNMPFSHIQGLPKGGKPVTTWGNEDEAFLSIAEGIEAALPDRK